MVEYHANSSTVKVTWSPKNGSRVDLYHYQLLDLTDALIMDSNTTDTTLILSDIPLNASLTFVISTYNCKGESAQVSLVINVGECNYYT